MVLSAKDLERVSEGNLNVMTYMVYSTEDNFVGHKIYNSANCYLHPEAFQNLKVASSLAHELGMQLKIYDAFRPKEAQELLWKSCPDSRFVANPYANELKLAHCRGVALDLTLIDKKTGEELDMGTAVDSLNERSYSNSTDLPTEALANRMLLCGIMVVSGFQSLPTEWWHYELPNYRAKLADGKDKYPIITDACDLVGGLVEGIV